MKTIFYAFLIVSSTLVYNKEVSASSEDLFSNPDELILNNPNHANALNLKRCALINTDEASCKFSESPLIGLNKEKITINDVLDKTMASKKYYLEAFKNALKYMPEETLIMFGSVNAIVISERISPSFYSFQTGAIYINADYLWRSAEEKAIATAKKDFRDSFGSTLSFSEDADYYKNGESLYKTNQQKSRTEKELAPNLVKLLFHELSHANDFFPRSFYTSAEINLNKTYIEVATSRADHGLLLSQRLRLSSYLLESMAEILYFGRAPTDTELNMNPKYLINDFLASEASDLYAYTNSREDLAMLVENNLMYYYFKYSPTTVFIRYPKPNFTIPKNYKKPIAGGIKNKIASPAVQERAQGVLERIFNEQLAKKVIDNLDKVLPIEIPENMSWNKVKKL